MTSRLLLKPGVLLVAALAFFAVACGTNDAGSSPGATPTSQAAGPTGATGSTGNPGPADAGGRLLVADPRADMVYIYDIASREAVAQIADVRLSTHLGALALPDGRAFFVDDLNEQFVAVQMFGASPGVITRVDAPAPATWGGVDADHRYLVYSSPSDDSDQRIAKATLVDLDDYSAAVLDVAMGGDGELHVALGGNPLVLFASTADELHAYLVSDVVAGNAESRAFTEVSPRLHGTVITHDQRPRILVSTVASFDVVDYDGLSLGPARGLPWDADGLSGGRNGRPRLSFDGGYIYGSLADAVPAEEWQARRNDIHIVKLEDETVRRIPLAPGIVGRFQMSVPYALFFNIHPDGDNAYLLDVNPASSTFQEIVATISLPRLSEGPVPGASASGTQARSGAITPDGRWAFIAHGGEGTISIIDTQAKAIVGDLAVPTPLNGGGYMLAAQNGARLVDLQVR